MLICLLKFHETMSSHMKNNHWSQYRKLIPCKRKENGDEPFGNRKSPLGEKSRFSEKSRLSEKNRTSHMGTEWLIISVHRLLLDFIGITLTVDFNGL